jgi:galactokinase
MGHRVIAAAIDLAIMIEGEVDVGNGVDLYLRDYDRRVTFSMTDIRYENGKDYLRSAVNLLLRQGVIEPCFIKGDLWGTIPIQAGTSSSSALVVSWLAFLIRAAGLDPDRHLRPEFLGEAAYLAEVAEFNEAGGRMDQYASAFGGIVHFDFSGKMQSQPLPIALNEFVLGDSLQTKPTQQTLKRVRTGQEWGLTALRAHLAYGHSSELNSETIGPYLSRVAAPLRPYLYAVIKNKDLTESARRELMSTDPDQGVLSRLMNEHQAVLRDELLLSTPRLNAMIDAALGAGALAAKVNGSGEGGCMFAYCPGRQAEVAEAIARVGGKPHVIRIGGGAAADWRDD